ncbi:Protein SYM1 [Cytospora mali]|uniref:Protein SYM1 n=1 Tax=Cytospora mali TaxID=578113 RepID=A0A194UXR7_CYTMA|nr:Protein SYM1 [Valsa mali var. pyri (nom. inval.)]
MASVMFSTAARTACNGKLASNLFRAQRLHMSTTPSQQLFLNPAKRSANFSFKSNFSTTVRRRQESQKAINSAATAPTPAAPVQPAFWERLGPLTQFFRWYGKSNTQRPYLTQFLSSLVIFCTGDLAAQYFGGEEYDYKRTLRVLAISAGSSIIIFKCKLLTLATKVGVNQVVYAPVFGTYYFTLQGFLSGDSADKVWERVKVAMPRSVISSWMFWPPITATTFAFVPPMYHAVLLACEVG